MRSPLAQSLIVLLSLASAAIAQVSVRTGPNGVKVMTNETSQHRTQRLAPRLLESDKGDLKGLIEEHAGSQGLDHRLVRAVVQVESGYNPSAVSSKGAVGLMQLMPMTARELGVSDPYDPGQNIAGGTRYLKQMLDRFQGDLESALAAYNAGPEAVRRYGGIPPYRETMGYVEKVMRLYRGDQSFSLPRLRVTQGRKTYVVRDADNRLVLTTTPPRR